MKDLFDIPKLLKLPPSILAAISLGTGTVLLAPVNFLEKLGLASIPSIWKTVVGIFFIVSVCLLIVRIVIVIANSVNISIRRYKFNKKFLKIMNNLDGMEKMITIVLYSAPNYTGYLPTTDGITARLVSKGIIQITSRNNIAIGDDMKIPYTITSAAQRYINERPNFIPDETNYEEQQMYEKIIYELTHPYGF